MVPPAALDRLSASARDSANWLIPLPLRMSGDTRTRRYKSCHSSTYRTLSRIYLVFASRPALQFVQCLFVLSQGIYDHKPVCLFFSNYPS